MRRRRPDEAGTGEVAELTALADGSLPPDRRAALEERVAAEPELAALLAEQQRAVDLARSAAADVEAPADLRRRIATDSRPARRAPMRRGLLVARLAVPLILAVALAVRPTRSRRPAETPPSALAPARLPPPPRGGAAMTETPSRRRGPPHAARRR